ncbi:hypothetical protein E2C01_002660 [Portunus trituberculatus]|uniref:Uncharacterized protein n=1 Tax=Portunus trituberculatus TaxID=210409 RepID=A0A5B7CLB8_PORTR|nr:hypothetical protein [Portunus trituberculatus]
MSGATTLAFRRIERIRASAAVMEESGEVEQGGYREILKERDNSKAGGARETKVGREREEKLRQRGEEEGGRV